LITDTGIDKRNTFTCDICQFDIIIISIIQYFQYFLS
jgi:hypothetical protein